MTKFEEAMLLAEELEASLDNLERSEKIVKFIKTNNDEIWLHIDEIRKMLNEFYESVLYEVSLINTIVENSISMVDYETAYTYCSKYLEFIKNVKETLSIN